LACLHYYRARLPQTLALFVNYGQPASRQESKAARRIARLMNIPLLTCQVKGLRIASGEIPGRNALLLNVALMSLPSEYGLVALGVHAGTDYSDCSPTFLEAMQHVFDISTGGRVRIDAPFAGALKGDIFTFSRKHGLPVELTYSGSAALP
jgi:7-cyano-7-deazaguanine synthase